MSSYEGLAASYDALTTDVGYEKRAGFLEKLKRQRLAAASLRLLAEPFYKLDMMIGDRRVENIGLVFLGVLDFVEQVPHLLFYTASRCDLP